MRVLICGVDGYLGWALAQRLASRGHEIGGIDNYNRRHWVKEEGAKTATPIKRMDMRLEAFRNKYGNNLTFFQGNVGDFSFIRTVFQKFEPDAIVHLAEMPSAPFSMIDFEHSWLTHENNLKGTLAILFAMRDVCPHSHLVKLGTMGEYGTPEVDIPEGTFDDEAIFRGKSLKGLMFPRYSGSWYHNTKIHDTVNVEMACRLWKLKSTDIMQGVVYGTRTPELIDSQGNLDENLCTRFDFGECFGTAINRFCAQTVIGHPLTPYGKGNMKRGFLPLEDSVQCMTLVIENPPIEGQQGTRNGYRVLNQFDEAYSINQLAQKVVEAAQRAGLASELHIKNVENPRIENEENYYNPDRKYLLELGYQPKGNMDQELDIMIQDLIRFKERIMNRREAIMPKIGFDGKIKRYNFLEAIRQETDVKITQFANGSKSIEIEQMFEQVRLNVQDQINELIKKEKEKLIEQNNAKL